MERKTGSKYDGNLDITDIARLVRADIKAAVKKGELPTVTYSVRVSRFSMGQALTITAQTSEPVREGTRAFVPKWAAAKEKLTEIGEAFRDAEWDGGAGDYSHSNFFLHTRVETKSE